MNFFAALKSAEFATKLLAAAKLDFSAMLKAGDEAALKAHLEAEVAKAVAAAPGKPNAELATQVATLEAALTSAKSENDNLSAALSGIGFKGEATADSLKSHIKLHAAELLASAGHAPVIDTPVTDATKAAAKPVESRVDHYAEMEKLTEPKARTAYFQKHLAKGAVRA